MPTTCFQSPLMPAGRARMRALIADGDPVRRSLLRRVLLSDAGFDLVAEAADSDELFQVVERALPELVVGSFSYLLEYLDQQTYPVLITAGTGPITSERVICNLTLPLEETEVAEALAAATARILNLKAGELSSLVRNYLAYGGELRQPLQSIAVEQGDRQVSISIGDIRWIKADGNYVRLYTRTGTFELRNTLSELAARLEPSGFARIHRGVVVNTAAVRERALRDGVVAAVVLDDGTHLLVGRKFRHRLPAQSPNASVLPLPRETPFRERIGQELGN